MKLALGSVQFGMAYGVTNNQGPTPSSEVVEILNYARDKVKIIDTASSYGTSEELLGMNNLSAFNIVTKTPVFKKDAVHMNYAEQIQTSLFHSLAKLRVSTVYGLLIHDVKSMYEEGNKQIYDKMTELKQRGYVQKIGISVYTQQELEFLCNEYSFDLVQIPINLLDQRLMETDLLKELKKKKIEIHARSIFLQGVLLQDIQALSNRFLEIVPKLKQYDAELKRQKLTRLEGALLFVNSIPEIDYIIVGVNNLKQLIEVYDAYCRIEKINHQLINFSQYACINEQIIDPRRW